MAELTHEGTEGFDDLLTAVRRRYGTSATIDRIVVPTLGGSNRTVIFDLVQGNGRRRMVSRQETYSAADSPFLPTHDQFRAMRAAFDHGVPVPEPLFELDHADGMGFGFVTDFVSGETMPKTILTSERFDTVRPLLVAQIGGVFAKMHSIPAETFAFLAETPDSRDPIMAQRDRYDGYGQPRPAIEAGLRWLERNRPPAGGPRPLHGDFRLGNLMVAPDKGAVSLLDWECAHLGSPAEDLGWLCMRSWRFGQVGKAAAGLGSREDLLAAYTRAGGTAITPDELRYWEVFGLVRWAILNIMQGHGHINGERRGLVFAACGRNTALIEYDLLMTLAGHYD
ncbi:putative phosphotransferase [Caenibius tardaugens NBRC 16725]|uniref:Putative phosphotransferase n=1 Tax=Caenibius tardaugens NBRC 16725 TaxID=1219035 RepID=U2ZZ36_9SPHN|nr:phosphotransferase family protein [Caenibius tardaugens]AZI37002.1 phosphotransferase family protein [Caenibius tardaugens NBRC 16725]GAD47778.1 putative phosphotransferase [Caenibius tardaugens NBRC 16725]